MRLSTLFAASFVSFTAAQAALPACALSCLTTTDPGSCTLADQACLCRNQAFITASMACIQQSCSADDAANTAELYSELCAAVGVTQTFAVTVAASETASVAASVAASASAAASSVTSAVSASVSAIASSASSRVASAISSASAAATSAAASATATSSKNAAPTHVVGHGAVVAGIVAVAALAL
ncbi:hypothetical protein FRC04_005783 [Tulasnella sp. 424]|nr:hypothetical protein FRC04_005783 [Tulasnella sp. 424]KAG8961909.1 hypothetical protein FRC05_005661 [Tulasnella sp. 425]